MPKQNRKEFYPQYLDFIFEENDKMFYLDPKMKVSDISYLVSLIGRIYNMEK